MLDRVLVHSRYVGKERVFMVGLFAEILLWPFRMLLPHWAIVIHCIGAFGLTVALIAAFVLLLEFSKSSFHPLKRFNLD